MEIIISVLLIKMHLLKQIKYAIKDTLKGTLNSTLKGTLKGTVKYLMLNI